MAAHFTASPGARVMMALFPEGETMRHTSILLSILLAAAVGHAQAKTLRWATQGDPQTMDPYSQNEQLTNNVNGQIYEKLVDRDKQLNIVPFLAVSWQQVNGQTWRFKLRPNVKVIHRAGNWVKASWANVE
jgi:ABC-type transport system substrate-binding protein